MKKSRKLLILLRAFIFINLLAFVIPLPEGFPIDKNFITNSASEYMFENLSEIEATNGIALYVGRGSNNRIKVEAFGSSDCFQVGRSQGYANLHCDVARYFVEFDQAKELPNLSVKSSLQTVYINYNRIKNLDLRPNNSTCIIQKLDSLNRLEILGSNNSVVKLKECFIDTLIIDGQTKLIRDKASRVNFIKVNPDYSPKTIFLNDKKIEKIEK